MDMVSMRNAIVELMERELAEEQTLVAGLTQEERDYLGSPERWSARNLLSHLSHWKQHQASNLMAVLQGGAPVRTDDFDAINDRILAETAGKPWQEILESASAAHSDLLSALHSIPVEWLASTGVFPWQEGRPLWQLLVGEGYTHPIVHFCPFYLDSGRGARAHELQSEQQRTLDLLDDSPLWRGTARYNLACFHAITGDVEGAAEKLSEALQLRPDLLAWSKEDPDFRSVRGDPRFQAAYNGA